jgi:hypothetical protein
MPCSACPEKIHNQAFNVGVNEENYQVRRWRVRRAVVQAADQPAAKTTRSPQLSCRFSKRPAAREKFQWNAQKGAEELYLAYRQHRLSAEDFQGRKYVRLKQLKYLLDAGRLDNQLRWS